MNSYAVQSILSSPSTLYQPSQQGLQQNNLELEGSSSSNSSGLSDYVDAIPGFGYVDANPAFDLNTSFPEDTNANDQSTISYSLPPMMAVKQVEQKILPDLSKGHSSSASDDNLGYSKYGDAFNALNTSRQSQSSVGQTSPRSKKREWRLKMSRKLGEIPVGELNPDELPLTALMNVSFRFAFCLFNS